VPHGHEPTNHILKPGISDLDGHALNEHLCLSAARRLGLRAAMSSIEVFEDQAALAVHPDRTSQHDG
jgi:serine/threonine-protein kinase HipA